MMGEVIKVRPGKGFDVRLNGMPLGIAFRYRAFFAGPLDNLTDGDEQSTTIHTDADTDTSVLGGGIGLHGTVPEEAAPGLYPLSHVERTQVANGETRSIPASQIANAPDLEVVAESDWPAVRF